MSGTRKPASGGHAARSGSTPAGRSRSGGAAQKRTGPKGTGKKAPAKRGVLRTLVKYALIMGIVGSLMLMTIFFIAYKKTTIPDPNAAFQSQASYVYYSGGKSKIGQFAQQNRESVNLNQISLAMRDAAVAAEDRTFWTNKGIDPKGILRAAFSNAQGNATQGASTITQQYVKLLYLTQQRTLSRKAKEAFLSLKVQQQKSKEEILEGYLNTIYFGRGSYGVEAAAEAFFGVNAKQLNVPQSAMLAAVLNSPNYLSPDRSPEARAALQRRYAYVLDGMVTMGTLDAAEAEKYRDNLPATVKQKTSNSYGGQKGFMLTMVKKELAKLGFDENEVDSGGLRVETTFTRKAMRASQEAVAAEAPKGLKGLHAATASVDVKTGAVLGFYAGQNYLDSQLNWAVLGGMPGSTFKPFAVAAGIDAGFSLKDTFDGNSPYVLKNGDKVRNSGENGGHRYGTISLLKATEDSVNTAFMDLTESIPDGPQKIVDMAVKMGIPRSTPNLKPFPGVSLGSVISSPIAMANAYATIANGGLQHDAFTVRKVTRASDGEVLYRVPRKQTRAISEDLAADTSYSLQQVVKVGTGRNAQALGRPAAGKTGTATNAKDQVASSWFVGYTPQVSTAVMYVRGTGNENLEGFMPSYFGANYPTYTWRAVMRGILEGEPTESFPPPANLDGEAPSDGHAPYTPPPKPKPEKKPKPTQTPTVVVPTTPPPSAIPDPDPDPDPSPPSSPPVQPPCGLPGQSLCPPQQPQRPVVPGGAATPGRP